MFKIKEIGHILIALILFAFVISFLQEINVFLISLLIAFIILAVNILAKKIIAHNLDTEIEQKIWQFQRWGFYERSYFKKPIPVGILLPFLLVWLSYPIGFFKVFTFLQFDIKAKSSRAAKKHGLYRFSELTEWHIAAIPLAGIAATLVLGIIAYILGGYASWLPLLAKYSIYYSLWNLLPLGQLDGTKILFGSRIWWIILMIISVIGTCLALFLI